MRSQRDDEFGAGMLLNRKPLVLRDKPQVARGNKRALFLIDGYPDVVVKVVLPREGGTNMAGSKRLLRRFLPSTNYRFLFREYKCYLTAKLAQAGQSGALPIIELRGLVQTDLGPGMIEELIKDGEGNPGTSLRQMIQRKMFQEHHLELLNDFVRRIFAWRVRANDLNPSNILFGQRAGISQFVLVDGLGDSHLIPVRTWSGHLNERSLCKRFEDTSRVTGLTWDAKDRVFGLPRR
ncbi:PhoP regulatory network YrbL family protein [Rhodovulum sulfidophilum]|nr:PhoP regulatory network YrbL family protein [Rhodovulum sulfidophilum]